MAANESLSEAARLEGELKLIFVLDRQHHKH
jgi:hypothetical protein